MFMMLSLVLPGNPIQPQVLEASLVTTLMIFELALLGHSPVS